MLTTLMVVLPIFALIFAGYVCRRVGILGPHATSELNRFVVYLALPALLFDIMAHASAASLDQPGFIAAFGLSSLLVFLATLAVRLGGTRRLADASIDGLNAAYANTGFIGFPLAFVVFGKDGLAPTTIATIITVCVIFAFAIVLIEIGLAAAPPAQVAAKVLRSLVRNPLLVSPLLGAAMAATGWPLPASVETFFKLLGNAASPCALVALGLFLAEDRRGDAESQTMTLSLVVLKLAIQPTLAWLLSTYVLHLPTPERRMAVLLAGLPTGTGPFMLAEFYGREAVVTAKVILISTVLSLATVTTYLAFSG